LKKKIVAIIFLVFIFAIVAQVCSNKNSDKLKSVISYGFRHCNKRWRFNWVAWYIY